MIRFKCPLEKGGLPMGDSFDFDFSVEEKQWKDKRLLESLSKQSDKIKRLREGLEKYGRHKRSCLLKKEGKCNCGLSDYLE
jgi:hypothetical protein